MQSVQWAAWLERQVLYVGRAAGDTLSERAENGAQRAIAAVAAQLGRQTDYVRRGCVDTLSKFAEKGAQHTLGAVAAWSEPRPYM